MNIAVGITLLTLRKNHNYTQQHVADLLYVSRQTYSGWENNCGDMPLSKFLLLAPVYGMSTIALLKLIETDDSLILHDLTVNINSKC